MLNLSVRKISEAEENRQIVKSYRELLHLASPYIDSKTDIPEIRKAFNVAVSAHRGMRRKSGEPFIFHPISVAKIVVEEMGLGKEAIMAALMHDVVEDTDWELNDIAREFGQKISEIVDGLTKISGISKKRTSQQAENFRKVLLTLSSDVRVILVKIADRLHNMRTLESMPRNKQLRVASETIYFYAPLAHRLGLFKVKQELEDLYLKYAEPDAYYEIEEKIKHTEEARQRFIRSFVWPIENDLKELGFEFNIKSRLKSMFSIYNKMRKRGIPFEEVYDLFAIRIILYTKPELEKVSCWQVYSVVTDYYKPNPERLRDWLSTPKSTGYESLHTTVMSKTGQWVEVQIRSNRMDQVAEKGVAAHWIYKDGRATASEFDRWLMKVREMLENKNASAVEFVNDFRSALFSDEVSVFTPKGDTITMPVGSTVLDFAFEIHTDIGLKCLGAKVNQKLVSISYKLKNGDQIEAITSQKIVATDSWENIVITNKATSAIKNYVKEERQKIIEIGQTIVSDYLKKKKEKITKQLLEQISGFFDEYKTEDFLYKVGKNAISEDDFDRFMRFKSGKVPMGSIAIKDVASFKREISKFREENSDLLVLGEDMDKIAYILADCCNPIPGDDVFGYVSENQGLIIHRTTCPKAIELMSRHEKRILKAKWTSRKELAFLAGLSIKGTDRLGVVNQLTHIITQTYRVNIKSIRIDTQEGVFSGKLLVYVKDTKQLLELINTLRKEEGITHVNRFDL